jgi:peptidoglycan hydrolase-like protein with peptidoglycan-binding domain
MVGLGSTGKTVRTLQDALGVEVDDIDGRQTTAALKAFQAAHGLRPDGIAGPKTWAALEPTVEDGSRGEAVRRIQRQLGVAPDAIDGPQTTGAVKHFQQAHGLTADGIVGPRTWKALEGAALQGAAGRTMVVQYGPSEREAGLGYRQSGQILEVRDGMVTQDTGRSTVSYKMSDLTANAADAAAVQKMLDPGQDVRISVEPGGVQVTSLDRGHNLDRTQIHSR